jgi:hypothetical protein
MSDIRRPDGIDRREFLGAAGGVFAAAFTPLASIVPAGPVAAAVSGPELLNDWTIDDMWGVNPRYADAIGYGRVLHAGPSNLDVAFTQTLA